MQVIQRLDLKNINSHTKVLEALELLYEGNKQKNLLTKLLNQELILEQGSKKHQLCELQSPKCHPGYAQEKVNHRDLLLF